MQTRGLKFKADKGQDQANTENSATTYQLVSCGVMTNKWEADKKKWEKADLFISMLQTKNWSKMSSELNMPQLKHML